MRLSKHFMLWEFTKSQTASRKGIDNRPNDHQINRIKALCEHVLEPVREHFKSPVIVSSGFRSERLNRAIGGSKNSQHSKGEAADIEVVGVPNMKVAEWIRDNLDFDQLILEFAEKHSPESGWCHVSFRARSNRSQVLSAKKVKRFARKPKTMYISGLNYV